MSEMENIATCQALQHENCWSFQPIFFFRKIFIKSMEIAQATQKTSQCFCFQVQKIRLFYE